MLYVSFNWNKYQSEQTIQPKKKTLNHLIDPSFSGVNRLFVLLFGNDAHSRTYRQYFVPTVGIKDYNVMNDGKGFFDQPVRNDLITYGNIAEIATGQREDYTTGCLLDYN